MKRKAYFLTDASPFPPHDGRKVPVANYFWEVQAKGYQPEVIVVEQSEKQLGLRSSLRETWLRIWPFGDYFTTETIPEASEKILEKAGSSLLFVAPARLIGLARVCKLKNPALKVVLLLNDAQWSMGYEAFLYGIGYYPGGRYYDLLKGFFTPTTFLREMIAYAPADVVVLQTERELSRLPWLRNRAIIAPNAVKRPQVIWNGKDSKVFAVQVNFDSRRVDKLRPFITKTWLRIHSSDTSLELHLFGPGEDLPNWARGIPGIHYTGLVDDLDKFLASKRALLVPIEHSTGISNTVLSGLAMDMPMVITKSSSLGVVSVIDPWPKERVRIAKNAKDFIRHVLDINNSQPSAKPRQVGSWTSNPERILDKLDLL